jgi:hypothetical protein
MARYDYPKYEEQQPDPEKPYEEAVWYIPPYQEPASQEVQYTPPQWTPPVEQRREEQNPPSYFYQEPAYQEVKPPVLRGNPPSKSAFSVPVLQSQDLAWMRSNVAASNVAASGLGISDPRDAIGYGGVPQYRGNTPARDYQASQAWSDYNYNPPSGFDYGLPTYSPSPTQPKYYEATGRDSQAWSDYNYNPPESVWSRKPSNYRLPRDKVLDPRDAPGYVGPTKYGGGGPPTKPPASPTSPQRPANYGAPGRGGYGYPSYGGGGYGGGYTGGARVSNGGVEPEGKWYEGLVNWRF